MRQFGLIGKRLDHSFSKTYFQEKFINEQIKDAEYDLYPLESIKEFKSLIQKKALKGLNVTIPYKTDVMTFLDDIDPIAQKINAVNTIVVKNGKTKGYNTDYLGFQKSIRPFLAYTHRRALILGTGGASKAIKYSLEQLNISYIEVSREANSNQLSYTELDEAVMNSVQMIVNCTPLGTFPKVAEMPPIPYQYIGSSHFVVDLIYNPSETAFMAKAKSNGALVTNGLNMLKIQAEESWKLWNT